MIAQLQEYLLTQGGVKIPGLGFLNCQVQPARYDVTAHGFAPPSASLAFTKEADDFPLQHQHGFLARKLNLSEEEVFEALSAMERKVQAQMQQEGRIALGALGDFSLQPDSSVLHHPATFPSAFSSLAAERVIRQGAVHQMVVGDNATNSAEMTAYYTETPAEKDNWWWLPLVVGLVALVLITWKRFG